HYEPFGIVALEAAATGAPLVTSTAGGLGEAVIDGVTGKSFKPRDIAGLTAAVRAVLDDPEGAQPRAVAARERLTADFDWRSVAAETAQVCLAANRREREPLPRRLIVEHALPDRGDRSAGGLLAFDVGQRRRQLGAFGRRRLPGQSPVLDHLGRGAHRDRVVR